MNQQNVHLLYQQNLGQAIERFLAEKAKGSANTAKGYRIDIGEFFIRIFGRESSFISEQEFNNKVNADVVADYFIEIMNKPDRPSNSTINRKQSAVKSLLVYLKARKLYHHDLSELSAIKSLKKNKSDGENNIAYIPFDKAMAYAKWLQNNEKHKATEKYLITLLAIDTGLRVAELLTLKWSQFTPDTDSVLLKGFGKGGKQWFDKISLELYEELKNIKKDHQDKLFTLNYSNIDDMFNRAKKALGDEDTLISFHSLKKCAVVNTYRLTGDFLAAKRKGRHSSPETTMLYLEESELQMTGLISLAGNIQEDLYEKVEHETLLKAIELMGKDFKFILNNKIKNLKSD